MAYLFLLFLVALIVGLVRAGMPASHATGAPGTESADMSKAGMIGVAALIGIGFLVIFTRMDTAIYSLADVRWKLAILFYASLWALWSGYLIHLRRLDHATKVIVAGSAIFFAVWWTVVPTPRFSMKLGPDGKAVPLVTIGSDGRPLPLEAQVDPYTGRPTTPLSPENVGSIRSDGLGSRVSAIAESIGALIPSPGPRVQVEAAPQLPVGMTEMTLTLQNNEEKMVSLLPQHGIGTRVISAGSGDWELSTSVGTGRRKQTFIDGPGKYHDFGELTDPRDYVVTFRVLKGGPITVKVFSNAKKR